MSFHADPLELAAFLRLFLAADDLSARRMLNAAPCSDWMRRELWAERATLKR